MNIEVLAERFGENHAAVMEALAKVSGKADEALDRTNCINAEIMSLQQRAVRGGGGNASSSQTPGDIIVASTAVKDFADARERQGRVRVEIKTLTSLPDSAGALVTPQRDTLVPLPTQRLVVRDLLNTIGVSSGSVEYPRMVARTNAAAPVLEGAAKPESNLTFELETAKIVVIAHYIVASRQILDDAPQLRSVVNSELVWGVRMREEQELLLGDGSGAHLLGMIPQATAFAAPIAIPTPTPIDIIAQALLQISLADYEPTGVIVNPADYLVMRTLKNDLGEYILGSPQIDVRPRLWGLDVVPSKSMPAGQFLAGDFRTVTLYDRLAPVILVSSEHADLFTKNMILILGEERVGMAVKAPLALVVGDFTP